MTAAYRIPITPRLRPLAAQIAQEYRDGAGFALLVAKYQTHSNMIGAILLHEGVERRKRGGNHPGQNHRGPRVSRLTEQHNGDRAIFAKPCKRNPCPHGVKAVCVMAGDPLADRDACRFSRTAEGRVSVASSFGREALVHGGMR